MNLNDKFITLIKSIRFEVQVNPSKSESVHGSPSQSMSVQVTSSLSQSERDSLSI